MASVIYLTDTRFGQRAWEHPSARHRCYHYADALLAGGVQSVVMPMDRISVKKLANFDHVIFHRPTYNKRFIHALNCCRQASVRVHADYDDLIFRAQYAQYSPLYINGNRSLEKVADHFDENLRAAQCFDNFITSTTFLKKQLQEVFPSAQVTVLPNSLPRVFQASVFQSSVIAGKQESMLTLGYFPGSSGHGEDFKSIYSTLSQVLKDNVRLLIVGRMNAGDYRGLPNVFHVPFTGYSSYLKLLSKVDVSIAPLINTIFNQSKSAVKLIESVAVGTPIVASYNADMHDHHNTMSTLVGAGTDWSQALLQALTATQNGQDACRMSETINELGSRYAVSSRLPLLKAHLGCVDLN